MPIALSWVNLVGVSASNPASYPGVWFASIAGRRPSCSFASTCRFGDLVAEPEARLLVEATDPLGIDLPALAPGIGRWIDDENFDRPHATHGGRTPAEVHEEAGGIGPAV